MYDHLIAICQPDASRLRSILPESSVLLCPHPVDMYIPIIREEVAAIGFIASEYPPNVDTIRFFIQNCWPEIIASFEVSLNIYGNVCRFVSPGIRNVNLKGHILDQQQAYKGCDIMINPVRFGAGLKIKNIEALASGLPLLTTTHGSRGLEEACGTAFLCA